MMSNAIVMALAPVFFVLLLGYAAGKIRIVDNHHVDGLNALVMDFALPAALLAATASASRSQMIEQAPLFLVFGVTMVLSQLYLPRHVGMASGLSVGLAMGIGGVAAVILGAVADAVDLKTALTICAFAPALGVLICLRLPAPSTRSRRATVEPMPLAD